MKKKAYLIFLITLVVTPVVIFAGVWMYNYFLLQMKMSHVIANDARNNGIAVSVHYDYWINPKILVYDLKDISDDNSKADVFRVFLQFAEEVKDTENSKRGASFLCLDRGMARRFYEAS